MEHNETTPFIFYLTLEESLPKTFYAFDKIFKQLGFMLIPVRIDQLQQLLSSTEQTQVVVISSVVDSREMRMYNDKVRGLLKYVLKSKRITFMHLSCFSKLNDFRTYSLNKNYYFMKYPLDARLLASKIVRYYQLKTDQNSKWPGGKKVKPGSMYL